MNPAQAILASRRNLILGLPQLRKRTCEGGCGVIGIIGTEALAGRSIIRSCEQMTNRGNGKGGGVAAAGLFAPERKDDYALHVAYLDEKVRREVEARHVLPCFEVTHEERQPSLDDHRSVGLAVRPPAVHRYFVQPKDPRVQAFAAANRLVDEASARDEFVFQNSFRLNYAFYARSSKPKAFVLSHGKDLMILKAVGFAEQVARYYRLEEVRAHVWIGHQRYPTRGRVWHPGGAHPFAGLHEALVHNGDFANYYAVSEYLRQRGGMPLFVTDTEVAALLFDLYSRVLGYPLEYVIEALAPTPEGDFERLSKRRQRIYRALQMAHLNGSPDGPWFFIIARTDPQTKMPQLIGITDVSMLRPQVFALQAGAKKSFGAIGSEKQAIDAFFEEVAAGDPDVPAVADRYWNARGGSSSDGGSFLFALEHGPEGPTLVVRDKFGNHVTGERTIAPGPAGIGHPASLRRSMSADPERLATMLEGEGAPPAPREERRTLARNSIVSAVLGQESTGKREEGRRWGELAGRSVAQAWAAAVRGEFQAGQASQAEAAVGKAHRELGIMGTLQVLTYLRDRAWDTGALRRGQVLAMIDRLINDLLDGVAGPESGNGRDLLRLTQAPDGLPRVPTPPPEGGTLIIDARGFLPEGERAANRLLVAAHGRGWRRFIVYRCTGDRFLGCGLGDDTGDVRLDVYGSSGDYLGSGLDGAEIRVHGNAQDQVGQILKAGRIVIYGDVGQTFLYGAKGGEAFVMGDAAGRPLINAVGRIRATINGTSLDYCAESFMAGRDVGDGFVIMNGVTFNQRGEAVGLEAKYPGNNLFSLASGGACYLNDPYATVKTTQLNGAVFAPFRQKDWNAIVDSLRSNELLFGISIRHDVLLVDGVLKWPKEVFSKVVASPATTRLDWSSLPD
jgi:glutamate synthase domain-containing protein 1/glutamate synthase domain-containing protein 3